LKKEFEFYDYEKVLIDGIRIENDESWGLARASNTTPSLVFRFEGESEEALKKIIAIFQKALFAIDDKLEIKLN
jgi:phosphomannomutase/phosphoglucomutase